MMIVKLLRFAGIDDLILNTLGAAVGYGYVIYTFMNLGFVKYIRKVI